MKKIILSISVILVLIGAYQVADYFLFDGITPRKITFQNFQGNLYAPQHIESAVTVVLIGGGSWGDYWAQDFAKNNFVGFSLPYTGKEGLPTLPEEIDLAYFENALSWLQHQPEVHPTKIVVMGASRNAELALVLASQFPRLIHGVIAYAPSSVSWSNTVLPYNSDTLKPSWMYQGQPIPYLAMEKIKANNTSFLETLDYWKAGLARTQEALDAAIPVENINGPILLFSGTDDQVWPSAIMANQIEDRLKENQFDHPIRNIQYENAGHLISSHPEVSSNSTTGTLNIKGKNYEFSFGGTVDGDQKARIDAKSKLLEFLLTL